MFGGGRHPPNEVGRSRPSRLGTTDKGGCLSRLAATALRRSIQVHQSSSASPLNGAPSLILARMGRNAQQRPPKSAECLQVGTVRGLIETIKTIRAASTPPQTVEKEPKAQERAKREAICRPTKGGSHPLRGRAAAATPSRRSIPAHRSTLQMPPKGLAAADFPQAAHGGAYAASGGRRREAPRTIERCLPPPAPAFPPFARPWFVCSFVSFLVLCDWRLFLPPLPLDSFGR